MTSILRSVAAVAAAIAVTFILVVAVEFFSATVHPLPADFTGTFEEVCQHVLHYPQWILALAVIAWAGTAYAGTWTAGRLGNRGCALFLGLLILSALVLNISMLPYPIWFKIGSLIAIAAAIVSGYRVTSRRATPKVVA